MAGIDDPHDFVRTFRSLVKRSKAQLIAAAGEAAADALDIANPEPFEGPEIAAILRALNGRLVCRLLTEHFDAAQYFEHASKALMLLALADVCGAKEAEAAGKLKSDALAKLALAKVKGSKWLPPELRSLHYDGPGRKMRKGS